MPRRRPIAVAVLLSAAVSGSGLALAADEASKSPKQILADAGAAMSKIKSFHIEGVTVDKDGRTQIAADVSASGSADLRLVNAAGAAQIRVIGSKQLFYRANRAFWRSSGVPSATATKLDGRWVKMPTTSKSAQELTKEFTPSTIGYCLGRHVGTLSKRTETVDGKKVIVLVDAGDKPGTGPGRLYVAASGPTRVLRLVQTGPNRKGGTRDPRCDDDDADTTRASDARITRYDEPLKIVAPANALDLSKLQSGSGAKTV